MTCRDDFYMKNAIALLQKKNAIKIDKDKITEVIQEIAFDIQLLKIASEFSDKWGRYPQYVKNFLRELDEKYGKCFFDIYNCVGVSDGLNPLSAKAQLETLIEALLYLIDNDIPLELYNKIYKVVYGRDPTLVSLFQ